MLPGVVQNPFLGEGLVAGFNTSGNDHRPGFAWFFGRDAEWTSLALNAEGDFPTARNALEFLSKYQRAKPGRWSLPDVLKPATRPSPRKGFCTTP